MLYERISATSSIAASILTFALTILGFSNIELTAWWHFALAAVALIVCFILCLLLVELITFITTKVRRPEPRVNFKKDYTDIEKIVHEINIKDTLYDNSVSYEYKKILAREILLLCHKLQEKIEVLLRDSENRVIKNRPKIPDQTLLNLYITYCAATLKKHSS